MRFQTVRFRYERRLYVCLIRCHAGPILGVDFQINRRRFRVMWGSCDV